MSGEIIFVDTNIFVYARDASEPEKQPVAEACLRGLWRERSGRTSVQVLNEYFVTVTRKLRPGLSPERAWSDLKALFAWEPLPLESATLEEAYRISGDHALSWWDALIVAAALKSGSTVLYSEDMQDGLRVGNVEIRNPFSRSDRNPV